MFIIFFALANIITIFKTPNGLTQIVETPTDSMPLYSIYRKELISKGWLPVPQQLSTRPDIPEVVCGASGRLCTAYWLYAKPIENRERNFVLWETSRGLVVAPYLSD